MLNPTTSQNRVGSAGLALPETIQRWGGLASFVMAVTYVVPALIYLVGDLRTTFGPFGYGLADLLAGPLWGVCLVMATFALRTRIGEAAPHRMSLSLAAALLAATLMLLVALIRSANRQYHLAHPELNLDESTLVLVVWTTLVAGVNAAGWHLLGWSLLLLAWSGWTSGRLPKLLCDLYLVTGVIALFVYLFPTLEAVAGTLGVLLSIWQGIVLWKSQPGSAKSYP